MRGDTPEHPPYRIDRKRLDALYERYNHRSFVHPDPLEFLYDYQTLQDREIVGLIAASLAYGRVAQILRSVSTALERMGVSPHGFLLDSSLGALQSVFRDFRHRFTSGEDLSLLLWSARRAIKEYGSLQECFAAGAMKDDKDVLPALSAFVRALRPPGSRPGFLPSPEGGSACKRLNLFLRWMVREDEVDPGGWTMVPRSKLVVPLDTHMHRIGLSLGLTGRAQPDLRAALDITLAFRQMAPEDPVRYDFALTRLGIRPDMDEKAFLMECGGRQI